VKFGPVPVGDAAGAILAHSVRHPGGTIRKGKRLDQSDTALLQAAGIANVTVARLSPDDVHEDEAAENLARAIAGAHIRVERPFTGRANLYAEVAGVLTVDRALVDRINAVDPAITLATLAEYRPVAAGQMVGTVKIIPFAVERAKLEAAASIARSSGVLGVAPFRPLKVGLVATLLASLKSATMDKTRRLLDVRLQPSGASVMEEVRVPHDAAAVASAIAAQKSRGAELLIVFGASAVVDEDDVIPAAIVAAGGRVIRFGMPVDPGNLLVLGEIGGVPVIGAPGCARSPSENGFDWILNRILAGVPATGGDIARLGVGGLLMEIVTRPQPRAGGPSVEAERQSPRVAALLLAAAESRRMGWPNPLVASIGGRKLVRIAAEAALASQARSLTVVTGHRAPEVEGALGGLAASFAHNPDYADGLSTSLRTGLHALPADIDAAIVMLGDMPGIDETVLDKLIAAFAPEEGAEIIVPTWQGKRGNPVLWASRFFAELEAIEGDTGGRHLIGAHADRVVEVELGPAVALDVDTPEALAEAGGIPG
jgi:molybdenum cofactor cytidylyltransferase